MEPKYFMFILCCFSVFRLAEFVNSDDGPWFVMTKIRKSCKGHPAWCELMTCFYCAASWVTMGCVWWLIWMNLIELKHAPLWWAGIWGGSAFIFRVVREREVPK